MKNLTKSITPFLLILFAIIFFTNLTLADTEKKKVEIGIEENLGKTLPLDLSFTDEDGKVVKLRSLVDKPFILNFVYYECPGICSPLLTELTNIVNKLDLVAGVDYKIITLSFNEKDNAELARKKKANYLKLVEKNIPPESWRFLTGDSASIKQLTDAAGFMFKRQGDDFIHTGVIIAVSPEGKITRYLYGIQFLPFDVKMALIEAASGRIGPTISKLLQYCYAYNPEGRSYVLNMTKIFGTGILLLAVIFVGVLTLKPKKKKTEDINGK